MGNYLRTAGSRFGAGWTRFWFAPSDAIVLSLIRVLTAVVALWWYLSLLPDLQSWFGPNGLLSAELAQLVQGASGDASKAAFSLFDWTGSPSQLWLIYGLGLAALVMMLIGLFSRVATVASLVYVLSCIHRMPMMMRPVDEVLALVMFYLCLGPSGAKFSIDAWLRRRRRQREVGAIRTAESEIYWSSAATVAIRLLQIHLTLIYAAMIIAQLQGAAWWQGTALWWLMARPESRLIDLTGLSRIGLAFEYIVNFFTHAILIYELCFVFLIWNPLARPILLVLGALMWAALAVIGGSVSFAVMMIVASLAFLAPETLRGQVARNSTPQASSSAATTVSNRKEMATARR
ncbi:MAG TPA: hypothetical protein VFE46_16220 [Pirellulales bacterium]|jgi:hypothetical protein|nr:hypothetical protein [Pirellulales bacterium]